MPRPRTKEDLMIAAKENYDKLNVLIAKLSDEELNTPFDFSSDEKKKEAHWKRDKNLKGKLEYKKMLRYPVNMKLLLINLLLSV